MGIIKHKAIFIIISLVLVLGSLGVVLSMGLPLGIEFNGGALAEVSYDGRQPMVADVQAALADMNLGTIQVLPTDDGYIIKTRSLSETERATLFERLSIDETYQANEERFTSIGPSVGEELKRKAFIAIIIVVIAIILFIAFTFRHVSRPVSSWKYGIIAIITLIHDVLITTAIFVLLAVSTGAEVDTLFVVALLTVLGLSVNDTIVVFDRIRENLQEAHDDSPEAFSGIVGQSLNETIMRSINTSASTVLVLFALFILGPESTRLFALTLSVGMIIGTYSSIFLASPLLVISAGKKR